MLIKPNYLLIFLKGETIQVNNKEEKISSRNRFAVSHNCEHCFSSHLLILCLKEEENNNLQESILRKTC